MRTHNILFVTIAVLVCIIAAPTIEGKLLNGWEQIPDLNDPDVQEIARWAVAEHAKQANDGLQLKRVVSGMQQIVSGMRYKFRLDAVNSDGKEGMYRADAFYQAWTNTRRLDYFAPAQ
ncbi:hypothetical protein QYE76_034872 [Lolium multiflorum]|uniref:Cystatin domain-containing protein n=1 Tax=Lolium multiflorum TaxID=4521 RepID=A0AAD8R0H2_LOLMU|nr:hypothetical protein QYE76_034872 [Lolium multiflorum]